jgi:FlaA1/EpsC-like NDP-sugar epimerase
MTVEELLGRTAQAIPDASQLVEGRAVLVTGAGGSIGAELCRQLATLDVRRLILVERAETPLFYIEEHLRRKHPEVDVVPLLADVTDSRAVDRIFSRERPEVVFHAAAHKHVPLCESNVPAAVIANVRGTRLIVEAARAYESGVLIFISTDKAVDPSSVMGATKRIGERLVAELPTGVIVRFGNVLDSQGSVLELFRQQIAEGGPVTVTHPDMTRYFMSIPEAVKLILLAGLVGKPGFVHVLNMGQPIRILDLAKDLIGDRKIPIAFTGLRPGEKLEECLFGANEERVETEYPFLLVARQPETNGVRELAFVLEALAELDDAEGIRSELQ